MTDELLKLDSQPITGAGGGGGGKGGGGGGGGRAPVESPDDLRSRSYARLIDLVCEGEIEGLSTGDLRSVYLDGTPVMNSDGSYNFSGITMAFRNGTQSQSYIPGFPSVESEQSVGVQVFENTPVVRTISDPVYTLARVTMSIPQMFRVDNDDGDTVGSSARFRIQLQSNGGTYQTIIDDTITGKTTTRYQRSYLIRLTGDPPWNIRVERMSEDSNSAREQNSTFWDSYTEIVEAKLRYPNSALAATVIDSQQFNNIPTRGYDLKMLRIQIPSNATVRTDGSLEYTGTWDGTFQIAWSSNPAWCYYDMITNDRYGLGAFIDASQVDKWTLYQIGRYCDELVDDGYGGLEPRFSCNLYLQTQQEAFKVVQDMASIFRGMTYWSSGLITATQDTPSDPVALYSKANVVDGTFTYSGSSLKTRHSVALVSWNDPSDYYKLKPEYVEDPAAIARYGVIQTQVVAIGCTSRGQAHRAGKWLLYSEANETETVTFRVGLEGALARPGQIVAVQDADRAGTRLSGRLLSATTTQLTVDRPFIPSMGVTYSVQVMLPDGTIGQSAISDITGAVLTLETPLAAVPIAGAIWMVTSSVIEPQLFRVVAVMDAGDGQFEVTALSYNQSKYDYVEDGLTLTTSPISLLNVQPDSPQNISITESLYSTGSSVKVLVTIAWDAVDRADSYIVTYSRDNGAQVTANNVRSQLFEIRDAEPGLYKVNVIAISVAGKRSVPGQAQRQIVGKTAPPADVQEFSLVNVSNGVAQLTWKKAADLDVIVGGYVRIRYTPDTVTPQWQNAVDIGPALPGSATTASVQHVDGAYLAKFVDSTGNSSINAVSVTTTSASIISMNVVSTIDESAFLGTMDGTAYSSDFGGLVLDSSIDIDDVPDIDTMEDIDVIGGVRPTGYYYFNDQVDLGATYTCVLTAAIAATALDYGELIDDRLDIDSWTAIDGDVIDDVNATLYVRTTNDDPSGSPVWSSWRPFFVGQYVARAFEFKLTLTSGSATHNICVTSLSVTIDMPDRVAEGNNITSGAGLYSVNFDAAFKQTPAIGITAENMQTGDYYIISNKTAAGFDIRFKNSAGTDVSRVFDYIAKGYGYQQ